MFSVDLQITDHLTTKVVSVKDGILGFLPSRCIQNYFAEFQAESATPELPWGGEFDITAIW